MDILKESGVPVSTVAPPKEAKIGCGLAAAFDERFLSLARSIVSSQRLQSFYAIYRVTRNGERTSTNKIYP